MNSVVKSTDPRLEIFNKQILIFRPNILKIEPYIKFESGVGTIGTKDSYHIQVIFESFEQIFIGVNDEWPKDWLWTFV